MILTKTSSYKTLYGYPPKLFHKDNVNSLVLNPQGFENLEGLFGKIGFENLEGLFGKIGFENLDGLFGKICIETLRVFLNS